MRPFADFMVRKFKVMDGTASVAGAELRFRGQWLKTAGFHPGSIVTMENPEPGVMHLRVSNAPQLTAKDFRAVIERFEKLGL